MSQNTKKPPRKKARWGDDSVEDLWEVKKKEAPKHVPTERLVYSLSKDQVPEGFTSSLVETVDSQGHKTIKPKKKDQPSTLINSETRNSKSKTLPSRSTKKTTSDKPKAEKKKPSIKKPTSVLKKLRQSAQDKPTRTSASTLVSLTRPNRPVPVLQLSSGFKSKDDQESFDARAEERAKETIRQNLLRVAAKQRMQKELSPPPVEKVPSKTSGKQRLKNTKKELGEPRAREKGAKRLATSKKPQPTSSRREIQIPDRSIREKPTKALARPRKTLSMSPPPKRLSGSKRRRDERFTEPPPKRRRRDERFTEPPPKRRKKRPIYEEEEDDEELSDFIASDDDERWKRRYAPRPRARYYSSDDSDMEATYSDIVEEERRSYLAAKRAEKMERERERIHKLEKEKRLAQYRNRE